MHNNLLKAMRINDVVEIIYLAKDGQVSKRRVKVLQVDAVLFKAFCYLRKSTRTFKFDNILALVPVASKERVVV